MSWRESRVQAYVLQILCDSSNLEKVTFSIICNFEKINYIITDRRPSSQWMNFLKEKNVE